jgi:hypothetical protein
MDFKMNERIRQLALQALKQPDTDNDGLTVFDNDELEKFAELIVRECAELMEKQHSWITNVAASNLIRKHFGVEE